MLIKLINNTLMETDKYKAVLVMNSDASSTLYFYKILDFKQQDQLSLTLKMGDPDIINKHV